ncbi:protein-L-isoaspartate O-methyltransferase [Candidatus Parcubacteria bacterium]|nr:protein-L-isoaspartate O-methyltransferase [Candidatus Parcubacteria bacterium]
MGNLVLNLINEGVLKTKEIIDAFLFVDRKNFVLEEYKQNSYDDIPLPIGFGQTISQPFTVAFMLELLEPNSGDKILDVGSGSGWTTSLLAKIIKNKGYVFGVEIIPELVEFGSKNLKKYNFKNAQITPAGDKLGLPEKMPFDKILVSAKSDSLPIELLNQLKTGGIMVIPIQEAVWKITKISKTKSEIQKFDGFSFVPLIR